MRVLSAALAAAVVPVAAVAAVLALGDVPWKLVLVAAFWAAPGALIAAERPGAPIGWLLLLCAGLFASSGFSWAWLAAAERPGAAWAAWLADRASALIVPATMLTLLLPDGRLPARRWRPLIGVVVASQVTLVLVWALLTGPAAAPDTELPGWTTALTNPVGVLPADWAAPVSALEPWVLSAPLLLVLAVLVDRFRQARGDLRRRLADVLAAGVVLVLCVLVGRLIWPAAIDVLDIAGAALLAAVLTSVVLRRHLGRTSQLVGHAVGYAVTSVVVAAVTVAALALLQRGGVVVPDLAIGLVAATVAVLCLPLRDGLQRVLLRARTGPGPSDDELISRLTEQLLHSRQSLVTAQEKERAALRRELHDVLGPTLAGLAMQLGGLRRLTLTDPAAASQRLAALEDASRQALEDVRRLSRGLRPPGLDELGLADSLGELAERQGLRAAVHADKLPSLPAAVEVAAYRIGSEAITNVARHSGTARVTVDLAVSDSVLVLRVADSGIGVPTTSAGVGLRSMRERAGELGGRLIIRDTEGGGTTVEAFLPIRQPGSEPMESTS